MAVVIDKPKKINVLSTFLANQIAAGEVIERPASVVKELLENASDACASQITVAIKQGGLQQIKITDNGCGIAKEDLPLAVKAHATSKISQVDDLFAIQSLGFRGEALASISAVAKCVISSKINQTDTAFQYRCEGNQQSWPLQACAHPNGTTIDVGELFFNTPVRRKFMKSPRSEMLAIEKVVRNFALSCPTIAIQFINDDKVVLNLAAVNAVDSHWFVSHQARVAKIMTKSFIDASIKIDTEHAGMRLCGWLSTPEYMRSQNDKQYFYINSRMSRDKLVNHAIKQAYDELLYPGRHPAYVLYFDIAADEIDVNVHPTKHEVRFKQARIVHDFIVSQLRHTLLSEPSQQLLYQDTYSNEEVSYKDTHSFETSFKQEYVIGPSDCEKDNSLNNCDISEPRPQYPSSNKQSSHVQKLQVSDLSWQLIDESYAIIAINKHTVLCNVVALLKQQAMATLKQDSCVSRPILVPIKLCINATQLAVITKQKEILLQLGLQLDLIDEQTLAVRTIPSVLGQLDFEQWLARLDDKKGGNLNKEAMIDMLVASTPLSIHWLGDEEKNSVMANLSEQLAHHAFLPGVYKILTSHDGSKVLHGK